jgi:predicted negative regulator of RcsB-dependent stress response
VRLSLVFDVTDMKLQKYRLLIGQNILIFWIMIGWMELDSSQSEAANEGAPHRQMKLSSKTMDILSEAHSMHVESRTGNMGALESFQDARKTTTLQATEL